MLHINGLTIRVGGRVLLEGATVHVPAGKRVGLIGRNGSGKSTLLKAIQGEIGPEAGSINLRPTARLASVAQEAPGGELKAIDVVLAADAERTRLLAEAEIATDPSRIAEIHARLDSIGAHAAPARAATILAGLGFDQGMQSTPLGHFSGGWRMRAALAAALFADADLLLLDEPSNHLDLEAAMWLESFLASYPRTLILVSHDRDLLDAVADMTVHIDQKKLVGYAGGYSEFERLRAERIARDRAVAAKREVERKHLQSFVDRFRAKASKAPQAQSRLKRLAKLEPLPSVIEEAVPNLQFPEPDNLAPPLITLDNVAVGYEPGKPVLKRIDIRLDPDDRIALLGANGNGKSTLAKLLAGRLGAMAGELRRAPKLSAGYFGQHQIEDLNPAETAFQHLSRLMPKANEPKVRARLGRFGFAQAKADVPARDLSGGEKARLVFALITAGEPQMLILDEPTNHLDIDAREALVRAIGDFPGAVILVSHDSRLVDLVADRLWLVEDGTVRPYDGDIESYRKRVLDRRRSANGSEKKLDGTRKEDRRSAADARSALAPLRKRAKAAEALIEKLDREKAALDARLADGATYADAAKAADLARARAELEARIAAAEADWLAASEALETQA
ncbi:ABC-F family ATP-binding cassette domain-containing protein [Desertibaculum subflavum]|uniref:ABC-F family ATP-binding cassette domain-containing protein n=1 Tax=Desertibaculum subflavum TaxID=2268458 RepID=UPI000E673CAA